MVELVDSVDLGSTAKACRFESCCPHQRKQHPAWGAALFLQSQRGLEPTPMGQSGGLSPAAGCDKILHNEWMNLEESFISANCQIRFFCIASRRKTHLRLSLLKIYLRRGGTVLYMQQEFL